MKRPITIISSISSVLFLIAIIWFASGIYIDKKSGTEKADARFDTLLLSTKEALSRNPYGTPEFSNQFIRAIGNIDDFSSLKLEINGELVYSYPPSLFSLPSPELVKSYRQHVDLRDGNQITLSASLYLMTPGSIYNHSRIAFLLILVGTLIVFVLILVINSTEKTPSAPKTPKKRSESFPLAPTSEDVTSFEKEAEAQEPSKDSPAASQEEHSDSPITEGTISFDDTTDAHEDDSDDVIFEDDDVFDESESAAHEPPTETAEPIFTAEPVFEPEPTAAENEGLDIIDQFEQENQQLTGTESDADDFEEPLPRFEDEEAHTDTDISPITGIYLQSALERRLSQAISTESAQNTDVSLALVKVNGLDRGNTISSKVIAILQQTLDFDAQLFEYNGDSYAVINKGADLNKTVDVCEKLYNNLSDFLKDNNAANEVSIGISAVNRRAIQGERLILEADQALIHASQDPDSPIIAFRANPDKYREYMNGN